jgi:hypothetical protein
VMQHKANNCLKSWLFHHKQQKLPFAFFIHIFRCVTSHFKASLCATSSLQTGYTDSLIQIRAQHPLLARFSLYLSSL